MSLVIFLSPSVMRIEERAPEAGLDTATARMSDTPVEPVAKAVPANTRVSTPS